MRVAVLDGVLKSYRGISMIRILAIILLFTLSSCVCKSKSYSKPQQSYQLAPGNAFSSFSCFDAGGNLVRCENEEVVCYGVSGNSAVNDRIYEGVFCKFKQSYNGRGSGRL
jgi:hypothetical protein